MQDLFTKQEVLEAYRRAPEFVRRAFNDEKTTNLIIRIQEQYQLHVDMAGLLGKEVGHLLLGLTTPGVFAERLQQHGFSREVINEISKKLNEEIFRPLHEKARQGVLENGVSPTTPPVQMPPLSPSQSVRPQGIPVGWKPPAPPAPRVALPQVAPQARPIAPQAATPPPSMMPPSLKPQVSMPQPLGRPVSPQPTAQPMMKPPAAPQLPQTPPAPPAPQFRPVTHTAPLPPKTTMPGALPRPQIPPASAPVRPTPPLPRNLPGAPVAPDAASEVTQPRPYPVDPYREPLQ